MSFSITPEEIKAANEAAEIIASETNVRVLCFPIGRDEDGKETEVLYHHNTEADKPWLPLDVYKDGIPQHKPEFAAWYFLTVSQQRKDCT